MPSLTMALPKRPNWFNDRDLRKELGRTKDIQAHLAIEKPYDIDLDSLIGYMNEGGTAEQLKQELIDAGFDGIRVIDSEFGGKSYVAFDPTQIKSATGNRGTYDPTNPDITAALLPAMLAPRLSSALKPRSESR